MITRDIQIGKHTYKTCFSTRVVMALEARGGDADKELQRILDERKVADMFWLLHQMLSAGRRYSILEGEDPPPEISYDNLLDLVGMDDYGSMFAQMAATIADDKTPTVIADPAKNVEATPGA